MNGTMILEFMSNQLISQPKIAITYVCLQIILHAQHWAAISFYLSFFLFLLIPAPLK